MLTKWRGMLIAAVVTAALCGCYSGSKEPTSAGARGGGYGTAEKASGGSYGTAVAALEAGDFRRARRAIDALLAANPKNADAHYLAGLARAADGDLKGTLKFFRTAASLDDAMIAAHQQRGVIFARLGRKNEAKAVLAMLERRAAGCPSCPDSADLRAAIAAISVALGRDGLLPVASSAASDVPAGPPLRDARWLVPGTPITALSREPGSCLAVPRDVKTARAVNIGRVAFQTPGLLGGQAARLGISCATCHRNGRGNPTFFFPGVSGKPGTADVTTAILSSHRGDGIFNPKPIPDLAAPEGKRLISRDPVSGTLEAFIFGLIVKEFDGAEPTVRVLDGLSAYVRAISARACGKERAVSLATHVGDVRAAMDAAAYAWTEGDAATSGLMIASGRTALGMIDERYAPGALAGNRRAIRGADLGLEALQVAIGNGRPDIPVRIISWRLDMAQWAGALKNGEAKSLYDVAVLTGEKGYLAER